MQFDLVFEGGGVRGAAFLGALEAFDKAGHTVGRVMGTSVGGLTAALLATGHDIDSIRSTIFDPENGRFSFADILTPHPEFTTQTIQSSVTRQLLRDIDAAKIPNFIEGKTDTLLAQFLMKQARLQPLFAIIEHMSMHDDTLLLEWLSNLFNTQANGEDWASLGLAALQEKTGNSLTVIASDITDPTMLVLNHSTAPDLPLKWAIRMTMGVPYLFPPVVWQSEWGAYRQHRIDGHLIVDGALLSQFPIELFLSASKEIQAICGPRTSGNNVIGLLLDEHLQVPGLPATTTSATSQFDNIPGVQLSRLLLNTLLANPNAAGNDTLKTHVLHLPVRGVQVYDFDITQADLQSVINAAYNATRTFLNDWQQNPHPELTNFEEQYVQVISQKFIVSGDYYQIGDITNSSGIAIGEQANVKISKTDAENA